MFTQETIDRAINFAFKIVKRTQVAEDIVFDCIVKLYDREKQIDIKNKEAYLFGEIHNLSRSVIDKNRKQHFYHYEEYDDSSFSVEPIIESKIYNEQLLKWCKDNLPKHQQKAILHYLNFQKQSRETPTYERPLSNRCLQVLKLIKQRKTNKEMTLELNIKEKNLKFILTKIYKKFNTTDRRILEKVRTPTTKPWGIGGSGMKYKNTLQNDYVGTSYSCYKFHIRKAKQAIIESGILN